MGFLVYGKRDLMIYKIIHAFFASGLSSQQRDSLPSSPREMTTFESDSSGGSSPYEEFNE